MGLGGGDDRFIVSPLVPPRTNRKKFFPTSAQPETLPNSRHVHCIRFLYTRLLYTYVYIFILFFEKLFSFFFFFHLLYIKMRLCVSTSCGYSQMRWDVRCSYAYRYITCIHIYCFNGAYYIYIYVSVDLCVCSSVNTTAISISHTQTHNFLICAIAVV